MANLGVVKSISGIVKAIAENGTERILSVGDNVAENERIITGDGEAVITLPNGAEKNLGNNSSVALNEDAQQDALDEVAAIQAALANNPDFDPSDLPATAAGNAAAGGAGNEGHSIVSVDYLNPEMEPISGFETGGQTPEFLQPEVGPGEELLLKTNTNGTPVAGSITAFVDEDDLSAQGGNKPVVPEEFGAYSLATVSGNSDVVDGSDDLVDPTATTATGSLNASFGSDGAGDISFNAAATQPAGITSGGVALGYWVSDDGHTLVAYIDTGEGNEVIFTTQITDAGAYSITLYGQVDHALANAENNLVIDLGFTITDSNGDSAAGTLAYDIDDDSPLASDKSAGSFEEGTTTTIASDAVDYLGVAPGADGLESISAFTGGLGTLFIENGALKYTAPASVNSNGVDVATSFDYTVTDNDGDSVTHTVDLNISDTGVGKVTAKGETIDEDDIVGAGGNPAGLGDDDATTSGSISYTVGVDGLGGVSLSTGTSLTTVDGDPVNTVFNADGTGGTLLGYTGSDATIEANWVFTVELTGVNATSADYTTTLLQALQHTVTDDPSTGQAVETAFEDNINLVVNVAVTDGDGTVDTSNANFTISIDDDTPVFGTANDGFMSNTDVGPIYLTGDLALSAGADGLESLTISGREGTIGDVTGIIGTNGSGDPIILTSGGEPLHYVTNSDGSISAVVDLFDEETETEIESVVFNVSVDDTDGSYTVEFFGIVDEASSTSRVDLSNGNSGITGGSNGETLVLINALDGITITATATGHDGNLDTVNASGQGMGVAQSAEINGFKQNLETQKSEVLILKFTDSSSLLAKTLTEIGFVADQLGVGETAVVDLYLAGVKVGATLSFVGENSEGSSGKGDDFFVIKASEAGVLEFDEIQFSALTTKGESYRVDSLTLDTNPDVFDVTTGFDVTATDGDGDVVTTSFELTLDANEVIEGGAGNDILVGNGGLETLIGGEGDDILTGNGSEFGGVEADTFEFSLSSGGVLLNSGDDTITDFTLGSDTLEFTDVIEVDGLAGIGLSDAISSVSDVDGDVVLGLTNGGSITLADIGTGLIDSVGALETLLTPSHIDVN
ncbi:MAG: retention module-containing protein [Cycloclasticus sp.]|nr:retention module-containing protein [Cycloclasticus sp.]